MKAYHILYVAGLLAMAACSSEQLTETLAEGVPVRLSGITVPTSVTRTSASTTINDGTIAADQEVKVYQRVHGGTGAFADYIYTTVAGGGMTPPSPAPVYPLSGATIDIRAYTPTSAASGSFTVSDNQTTLPGYIASDLLWAILDDQERSEEAVVLNFEHKMSKFIVNVTAGNGVSQINSVTLLSVKPTVTFDPVTGGVGEASGEPIDITMVTEGTAATATGVALLPEQTYTDAGLLAIGVTLADGETTATAVYHVDSRKFDAGSYCTLNLGIDYSFLDGIAATGSWSEGGSINVRLRPQQNN
ncbi:MAG: fimbrillin family protein [Prevotella sp.]|nr:fimbrillin family protein [Prevotella sp.]